MSTTAPNPDRLPEHHLRALERALTEAPDRVQQTRDQWRQWTLTRRAETAWSRRSAA